MASTFVPNSRDLLKKNGYQFDTVERYVAQIARRFDFCGFADIIAFGPTKTPIPGCLAVQACSTRSIMDHARKVSEPPIADATLAWLNSGNRFEFWGWQKHSRKRQGLAPKLLPTFYQLHHSSKEGFYLLDQTELHLTPN